MSPHQTLVYISRLALREDPVRFLQDVLRPLLRALRALKDAVGLDAAGPPKPRAVASFSR